MSSTAVQRESGTVNSGEKEGSFHPREKKTTAIMGSEFEVFIYKYKKVFLLQTISVSLAKQRNQQLSSSQKQSASSRLRAETIFRTVQLGGRLMMIGHDSCCFSFCLRMCVRERGNVRECEEGGQSKRDVETSAKTPDTV